VLDCGYSKQFTGIPEDDEGLDIGKLKSEIKKFEEEDETDRPIWQKWTYRYVFYGVPSFSNPTGSVISLSRRKELVEVSLQPLCLTTDN
jgi:DNA-binding transcriptional MocR family regulator